MKLSKHFSYEELLVTDRQDLQYESFNEVPELVQYNAKMLVYGFLEPIRIKYDAPIRVNSFIRSPELNDAVGGSKKSQHIDGSAVDLTPWNGDKRELMSLYAVLMTQNYRQLILYPNFIHFSMNVPDREYKHEFLRKA